MEALYIVAFLPLLIVLWQAFEGRKYLAIKTVLRKKKGKGQMEELAKNFIGKECIIYTFNSQQIAGTVKEVSGGALLMDNGKETEVINLDFVVRMREYPRGKNGKKKSIVTD